MERVGVVIVVTAVWPIKKAFFYDREIDLRKSIFFLISGSIPQNGSFVLSIAISLDDNNLIFLAQLFLIISKCLRCFQNTNKIGFGAAVF